MTKDNHEYAEFVALHNTVLNIYKSFKELCEAHGLRYFAISGTTLGAVLWKGFIPWDDDMDIAMPVEDYGKFVSLKNELPSELAFSEYLWFGGKLHDKRTTFTNIHYAIDTGRYNGVFIDIVPLIALPDDKEDRDSFIKELKAFQKSGLIWDRYGELYGVSSKKELFAWQKRLLKSYKFGETSFIMDFSDPRYVLSAKGFLDPVPAVFEDTVIPLSSNAKNDLSIQYGRYKKYPPVEKRTSLHQMLGILDLNKPFSYYAESFDMLPDWCKSLFRAKHTGECLYLKNIYNQEKYIASLETENKLLRDESSRLSLKIELINSSKPYRLGVALLRPFSAIKKLFSS